MIREPKVTKHLFGAMMVREKLVEHLSKNLPALRRLMDTGNAETERDLLVIKAACCCALGEAMLVAEKEGRVKLK